MTDWLWWMPALPVLSFIGTSLVMLYLREKRKTKEINKQTNESQSLSIWCKLGFHDYPSGNGPWRCIRPNCDMIDLGIGECHDYFKKEKITYD